MLHSPRTTGRSPPPYHSCSGPHLLSSSGQTHYYSTVSDRVVHDLLAEVERERQREREQRKGAGLDTKDIDQEDEEDYMRATPLIEKLEKEKLKTTGELNSYEEPTDSRSDDDDERFSPDAIGKRVDEFQRNFTRHEELLKNFTQIKHPVRQLDERLVCKLGVIHFDLVYIAAIPYPEWI